MPYPGKVDLNYPEGAMKYVVIIYIYIYIYIFTCFVWKDVVPVTLYID